jgi:hypothetical protein
MDSWEFPSPHMGLMVVAGARFESLRPEETSGFPFHLDPALAQAVIQAVRRARVVSYIERGILPPRALRAMHDHEDPRDDHCIHLVVHHRNCLLGAIRCQFHRKVPKAGDPDPLFREMMARSGFPEDLILQVISRMETGVDLSPFYLETSGWLSNPDMGKHSSLGTILPAAVWGLGAVFGEFQGIATLRASNKAAALLARLGGESLQLNGVEIKFEDSFYRGPVQLMVMHSLRYHHKIDRIVKIYAHEIANRGIICAA